MVGVEYLALLRLYLFVYIRKPSPYYIVLVQVLTLIPPLELKYHISDVMVVSKVHLPSHRPALLR